MAIALKSGDGTAGAPPSGSPPAAQPAYASYAEQYAAYALPAERSVPSDRMSDYTWLLYGDKGVGKTTLASKMDMGSNGKVLFVPFEPGGKSLSIYTVPVITDWGAFVYLTTELEKDRKGFNTLVIDPGSTAYQRCLEYVCRSTGIIHPGLQKDYGASWSRVNSEFQDIHSRIASMGMGFIVIAHDKVTEEEHYNGVKYNKTVPVMSGSTEEFYAGTMDIIAHYHYVGEARYLRVRGSQSVEAKCRADKHFLTPNGQPVIRIPMGSNPDEAYAYLLNAWNNRQDRTYSDAEMFQQH